MPAKEKMAALCAHVEITIAQNAHNVMVVQHDYDDGRINLDEAVAQMTNIEQDFVDSGEEAANDVFKETIRLQIQELA